MTYRTNTESRPGTRPRLALLLALAGTCVPLSASAQEAGFGTELLKREAWSIRLDASAAPSSIEVAQAGLTVRIKTETAALVWRPRDRGLGNFVVRATVRIPPGVEGGAGLFFGGYDMEGMDRNWAACLVRRDGQWSIPHRNGVEFHDFRPWEKHAALAPAEADQPSSDVVEWVVGPERVVCRINGTEMYGFARALGVVPGGLKTIEGDVGIRVGPGVHATFEGFTVEPLGD